MLSLNKAIIKNRRVPWRIRRPLELWLERSARVRHPGVYRFVHFGSLKDPVRPVTSGPQHHFFGYYEKSPWNASGRLLLAHEASFNDRAPTAADTVTVGTVDPHGDGRFSAVATSHAWNWQQGAMLQWHPADPENVIVFNVRAEHGFAAVAHDLRSHDSTSYERPIYALAPDGKTGFSLNFARLATHRPGYGYAGVEDPWQADRCPDGDGIFALDLVNGSSQCIVSLGRLAATDPGDSMKNAWHYINHIQVSPGGTRIAFFHIWHDGPESWEVRLYTCLTDGSDLRCLLDTGTVSHYDWRDDSHILVWAKHPGLGQRFLFCDVATGSVEVFGDGVLTVDGHCSYSPDSRWILNDTYPDGYHMRTLMLVRAADATRIDIARLHSPKDRWWGEIRCDLHPRWNRDGTQVCIDSVHAGERQMYVVDVADFTGRAGLATD